MSGHGFHVHGPHHHEVEHVVHHGGDQFTGKVAVITAVLSTVGAIFGYMGGHTQNLALMYKNDAAIQKTAASNQWSYYQAKSNKQNLAEVAASLTTGEGRDGFRQAVERYKTEKNEIKATAEKFDVAAEESEKKSAEELHTHEKWALATTLIQVSIALGAIVLLTKRRWMLGAVYGFSGVGIVVGVMALLHS